MAYSWSDLKVVAASAVQKSIGVRFENPIVQIPTSDPKELKFGVVSDIQAEYPELQNIPASDYWKEEKDRKLIQIVPALPAVVNKQIVVAGTMYSTAVNLTMFKDSMRWEMRNIPTKFGQNLVGYDYIKKVEKWRMQASDHFLNWIEQHLTKYWKSESDFSKREYLLASEATIRVVRWLTFPGTDQRTWYFQLHGLIYREIEGF
ncbi:MAG TPA: hypothetical protein VEC17_00110, partial [Candidatus Binatia bacterium]|nr:hypothetical protein [Candidatus Binatia bacterium]